MPTRRQVTKVTDRYLKSKIIKDFLCANAINFTSAVAFLALDNIIALCLARYAIAHLSVCLSVCQTVDTKTVEVRIIKFSPYGSPMHLVFAG